ncbi:hypothetical protein QAD02_021042 [Eretmocerus hayati]|uniref:Uncharacterized protein n=1 Tax=Eretmocerus hayati TaxID=131215 RepID=A0ACC2PRM6_9HYME|nr:hypothetical protein QAD02_021042 [Eretmocerus hayati]
MIFTETWLHPKLQNTQLRLNGYNVYRQDRSEDIDSDVPGGGVLIAIDSNITSTLYHSKNNQGCEQVYVKMNLNGKQLLIGSAYHPTTALPSSYVTHIRSLHMITGTLPGCDMLLFGDLNLRNIIWLHDPDLRYKITKYAEPRKLTSADILLNAMSFLNLRQNFPNKTCEGYTLDLLFSNVSPVSRLDVDDPILPIDVHHPPHYFSVSRDAKINPSRS